MCVDLWLNEYERRLRQIGVPLARLYLDENSPLQPALRLRGYEARAEIGYVLPVTTDQRATSEIRLHLVTNEADWQAKKALHETMELGPDGHGNLAAQWVLLERNKSDSGSLRCYLILRDGEVCGAVGSMRCGPLLRIKNFVIHPNFQRQGIGRKAIKQFAELATAARLEALGVFGIEGGQGSALYEREGFRQAIRQVEWSKTLTTDIP
jgi:GNAT superfamily N-acetyltransferase